MRIYSNDQSNTVYLSPYTTVRLEPHGLHIYSTLFDTAVMLPCENRQAQTLLGMLRQGVEQESLKDFFQKELPEIPWDELAAEWMRQGVLE